jgi:16S rRNA (cytosine1402-N4)-methyltransferase
VADPSRHIPVLLEPTLSLLAPCRGETVLDCTVGGGGHARVFGERIGPEGRLVINDADEATLREAESSLLAAGGPEVIAVRGDFAGAPRALVERGLAADVVLADLGFSSIQMDDPGRGFSFKGGGPLDMRYDRSSGQTAADLVNTLSEEELGEIIRDYGEERRWRQAARKIAEARKESPISTTDRLAAIVRGAVGRAPSASRLDPATRTFQALRIAVNDELASLDALLESVDRVAGAGAAGGPGSWLASGARLGVISFHSLEDRRVKRCFQGLVRRGLAEALTRSPVTADEEEIERNRRARSAKLRVIRLLASAGGGGST